MSSILGDSFQYEVDMRGAQASLALNSGPPRPSPPRYKAVNFRRPYGFHIEAPPVLIRPGPEDRALFSILCLPLARVSVWVAWVDHTSDPLPALAVTLRPGFVAGSVDTLSMPAVAPKGLATLEEQHLFFQLSGFTAEQWSLFGHLEGGGTVLPTWVSFNFVGGPSACCRPRVYQP